MAKETIEGPDTGMSAICVPMKPEQGGKNDVISTLEVENQASINHNATAGAQPTVNSNTLAANSPTSLRRSVRGMIKARRPKSDADAARMEDGSYRCTIALCDIRFPSESEWQ
jgi:hypothetical protein